MRPKELVKLRKRNGWDRTEAAGKLKMSLEKYMRLEEGSIGINSGHENVIKKIFNKDYKNAVD